MNAPRTARWPPRVVLRDDAGARWLCYMGARAVRVARRAADVVPLLAEVDARARREGLHAAGFLSYEAASAFDAALPSKGPRGFPLAWFALFARVRAVAALPEPRGPGPVVAWRRSVGRDAYARGVRAVRRYIRAGDTYQVNYTWRLRARAPVDPWDLFLRMAGDDPPPFAAFVDTGEWVVCSASPELFLRVAAGRVESRPMKGTAPRGLWHEDDRARAAALRASAKDRAENVMIVDMVRNDLGRVALPGTVRVSRLFAVERHATVWQMTSTVRARTRAPLAAVVGATFPPASVTGAPKRRAMQIVAELEPSPRRVYTGAVGRIDPGGRAVFGVAIRTALLHRGDGRLEYGVGGGIVWDSTPAAEWAECLAKSAVLRPHPRGFDLLETLRWDPGRGWALLPEHLRRLARSAEYFGFRLDPAGVRADLARLAAGLAPRPHRVRLTLSRRGALRFEAAPLAPGAARFGDLRLARRPVDAADPFLYHKTTHRRVYEEALAERPGAADVLLFNARGEVTESTIANVAFEIGGALCTPPLRCGLLPGTWRARLLARGRLRERAIRVAEALRCPRVFLMNAVRGLQPVRLMPD